MVALTEQIVKGKTRLERLDQVINLNCWGQEIEDVSVVQRMPNVEVLSLSINKISTLRDFRHCTQLKELYLRKNEVYDMAEVLFLMPLKHLKVLWLCDNPCAEHAMYRQLVARALPSVEKLDNADITFQERDAAMRNRDLDVFFAGAPSEERPQASRAAAPPPQAAPPPPPPPPQQQPSYGSPARGPPSVAGSPDGMLRQPSAGVGGGAGAAAAQRSRKNILYAVMALVTELEEDDLLYVRREIEQRLEAMGR